MASTADLSRKAARARLQGSNVHSIDLYLLHSSPAVYTHLSRLLGEAEPCQHFLGCLVKRCFCPCVSPGCDTGFYSFWMGG